MKKISALVLISFIVLSCMSKEITMYHYDNSKYDGGEIDAGSLNFFFNNKNQDTKIFLIKSSCLKSELEKISKKIDSIKNQDDFDFGHYYNAFILKKDTLYSDYDLNYWRDSNKGIAYKLEEKSKDEIKKNLSGLKILNPTIKKE